jgi:hypothetical protein
MRRKLMGLAIVVPEARRAVRDLMAYRQRMPGVTISGSRLFGRDDKEAVSEFSPAEEVKVSPFQLNAL